MSALSRRSAARAINIWPGYVDALATLIIAIVFLLMLFTIGQFFLSEALTGRDAALSRLESQVAELADMLSLEQQTAEQLRNEIGELSSELQSSIASREGLREQLAAMTLRAEDAEGSAAQLRGDLASAMEALDAEREKLTAQVAEIAALKEAEEDLRARMEAALAEAEKTIKADRETIEMQLGELTALRATRDRMEAQIERAQAALQERIDADQEKIKLQLAQIARLQEAEDALRQQIREMLDEHGAELAALRQERDSLAAADESKAEELAALREQQSEDQATLEAREQTLAEREAELAAREAELAETRDELTARTDELAARTDELTLLRQTSEERIAAKDLELEDVLARLKTVDEKAAKEARISAEARAEVARLNRQLEALRDQLGILNATLEANEQEIEAKDAQIVDLGKRLNVALASKVQELARYRSEFFGRLREALGNRQDMRIVGDRFVFQSEVLFPSGSEVLQPAGEEQLDHLAETLTQIAVDIPGDIDWVLQVNGHTDKVPINNLRFPSNWELSTARALSVVKYLIDQGIPPQRLAATGFGEYQPIDPADDEIAYRRNRRIELKLTQH
jgi:chemotaxis protein MotB